MKSIFITITVAIVFFLAGLFHMPNAKSSVNIAFASVVDNKDSLDIECVTCYGKLCAETHHCDIDKSIRESKFLKKKLVLDGKVYEIINKGIWYDLSNIIYQKTIIKDSVFFFYFYSYIQQHNYFLTVDGKNIEIRNIGNDNVKYCYGKGDGLYFKVTDSLVQWNTYAISENSITYNKQGFKFLRNEGKYHKLN